MAVFWACVYRHALPLAWFIHLLAPRFFKEDFELIREVALARDHETFRYDVNLFYSRNLRHGGFLRRTLLIRVSIHRLMRLKSRMQLQFETVDERLAPRTDPE